MMKLATMKMLLCSSLLVISVAAQAEGDAAKGKKNTVMCVGCHGIDCYRTAFPKVYNVPKIGGQHPAYLVQALQAYKTGARSHPSMWGIAQHLSKQDMEDLAAYYAGK
jgi:cytochrome c553